MLQAEGWVPLLTQPPLPLWPTHAAADNAQMFVEWAKDHQAE